MSRLDTNCSEDVNKEDECVPSSSEDSQDGVSSPMDNGDEPEFSQKHYDIEPCYYSMTGKSDRNCRGKVYRYREDSDLKGFQSHDGTMYRLRDSVFVEISQNEPYVIAAICGFKYTKREHVVVKLTRYFRAEDIPDISLNLMKQERAELEINPHLCPQSLNRELFNSEIQITQPVSCLRGKCIVEYVKDVRQARTVADFSLDNDTFFFCLHYNQDSTKLASTHYAIRIGSAFQAKLPPMAKCSVGDEKDRDELLYRPNSIDEQTEKDYIRLARCFRTYTLSGNHMLDSQKNARSQVSDLLMDEAIIQLHRSGYKVDDALGELNANDIILTTDVDNMTQDDAKKFAKGIKQLGKNFSRIHRELLPHHSREQLVSYYYLWKKTPEATKPKQAARRINPTSIKRPTKEKVKVSRPTSTEYLDFDSASESDVENNGPSGRACHHCYGAESKDWHHANGLLLCTDCRLHYKKYGQLRHVANRPTQVPACLFKRSNSDEEESGVRTRAGKKEQRRRTPSSMSETPDRRSPSGALNGAPNLTAEETPTKRLNGAAKRTAKRPLHNGVTNNVEKANSVEPASPDSPPPKLTNGLSNGHAPGPSTPNGETVSKKMKIEQLDYEDDEEEGKMTIDEGDDEPMPVLNGFKKEEPVEEVKLEMNGAVKEENSTGNGPTTSCAPNHTESTTSAELGAGGANGSEVNAASPMNGGVEDGDVVEPDSECDTYETGTSVEFETKNASFVRSFVRSCGPRCARTDLYFKFKAGSYWDRNIKDKAEKKRLAAQNQQRTQDSEAAVKLLSHHAMLKKEQQQQQAQQQQQQAQLQQMQQIQAAALMGQLPPEVIRQMIPPQFGMDPATAMIMQQLMHAQQPQMTAASLQQQLAMQQHMEQQAAHHQQIMRMQELAAHQQQQKLLADQQRNAAAQQQAREREQRERERVAAVTLQQQQQQHAVAAANQLHPGLMAQFIAMSQGANVNNQDFARIMEMHAAHAAQQQQAQAQRELMERREREQREREQREREQREREQREREKREREQREQAAREQAQAQAAAAAQQAAQQAALAAQQMPLDQQQVHQLIMHQMMMNPAFLAQLQAQAAQAQQQQPQGANPLHLLQQGMMNQGAMPAEMMRRLHAESAMRPQHP